MSDIDLSPQAIERLASTFYIPGDFNMIARRTLLALRAKLTEVEEANSDLAAEHASMLRISQAAEARATAAENALAEAREVLRALVEAKDYRDKHGANDVYRVLKEQAWIDARDYLTRTEPKHASDCALHNGPAYMPGPCSCGADPGMPPERYGSEFPVLTRTEPK